MLGTGYFNSVMKIAKINSKQEKPICPNGKNYFPQNTKNSQSGIGSRRSPIVHQIQNQECMQMMLIYYIDVSVFHVGFFQNRYLSNINHFLPANRLILYMTKTELKLICNN